MKSKQEVVKKAFPKQIFVHGLCANCNLYLSAVTTRPVLAFDDGRVALANVNINTLCPQCLRLVNMVSVSKKPLKH